MSENQWLIVNGYDSRNSENRYFQSKNKELKFTGKVPADSTGAEIFIHYQKLGSNNKSEEKTYTLSPTLNPDGTFSAAMKIPSTQSQEIRVALETTDKANNTLSTVMSGKLDGNSQTAELVSDGETMQVDDQGILHSYSKNVAFTGKIEPDAKTARITIDYGKGGTVQLKSLIDADGNFTYQFNDLKAGNHRISMTTTDADGNTVTNSYDFSVGRKYGGSVILIDEDENVWTPENTPVSGNLFDDMFAESFDKPVRVTSFEVNGISAKAGETVEIQDVGSITVTETAYTFTPVAGFTGRVPDIEYYASNRTKGSPRNDVLNKHPDSDYSVLSIRVNDTDGAPYAPQLKTGNNSKGESAVLQGGMGHDVLIGDIRNSAETKVGCEKVTYTVNATNDTLEGNNGNDILFGDNISTHSFYGFKDKDGSDSYQALKSYLTENGGKSDDTAVREFITAHWQNLLDRSSNGGNDTLLGEAGDDILIGGAGDDVMHGGQGRDSYVFATDSNSGHDTIVNFNFDQDKLLFTQLLDETDNRLSWDQELSILNFQSMGKDGQTYQNSIKFEGIKPDVTLDDLLKVQAVLG